MPFVVSIPFVALTYAIHPSLTEVVRTLAPVWIAIYVGVALLLVHAWSTFGWRLAAARRRDPHREAN